MTTAHVPAFFAWWPAKGQCARDAERTGPPVTRRRGPVFIQDAVTPFGGETLLLSRLRADAEAGAE